MKEWYQQSADQVREQMGTGKDGLSSEEASRLLEEKGCRILNGLGMSLYQGVAQVELWSGKKAPVEAMRQELLRILEEASE